MQWIIINDKYFYENKQSKTLDLAGNQHVIFKMQNEAAFNDIVKQIFHALSAYRRFLNKSFQKEKTRLKLLFFAGDVQDWADAGHVKIAKLINIYIRVDYLIQSLTTRNHDNFAFNKLKILEELLQQNVAPIKNRKEEVVIAGVSTVREYIQDPSDSCLSFLWHSQSEGENCVEKIDAQMKKFNDLLKSENLDEKTAQIAVVKK